MQTSLAARSSRQKKLACWFDTRQKRGYAASSAAANRIAGEMSMRLHDRMLACLLAMMFILTAQAQTPAEQVAEEDLETLAIDPEALEAFKGMADYLGAAKSFAYETESSYDVVQQSGITVEFGDSRKIVVSRPDRLWMESSRRDGVNGSVIFDGQNIWAFIPDENVYATAEQPGDLDAAIEFAISELNLKAPLSELISTNLYDEAVSELTGALYLGESVVAGVDCEHLLMSNDYADFQMWIASGGQPVLKRIVITYREEPGQPQFRAQFKNWQIPARDTKGKFEFRPPADAKRIRFYVPAVDTDLEDAS